MDAGGGAAAAHFAFDLEFWFSQIKLQCHFDTDFILSQATKRRSIRHFESAGSNRTPLRSVSSDYWPSCEWVNQCDNVGTSANSWSKWLRFFVYKTSVKIFQWVQILFEGHKFFHKPLDETQSQFCLSAAATSCFFSLNKIQVKWSCVGFIACNQPVSASSER